MTWADTKAAYRLFDDDRMDAVDILDGYRRATMRRIAGEPMVLTNFYLLVVRWNRTRLIK